MCARLLREKILEKVWFYKYKKQNRELVSIIKKNQRFKNIHQGKRCFIIGNGPSLKEQDMSLLKDEIVFTVNKIAKSDFFDSIEPTYHFWADPMFFDEKLKFNKEFKELMLKTCKSKKTITFFESVGYKYIKKNKLLKATNACFFKAYGFVGDDVNLNFSEYVSGASTVVHYAIEMAIYMGFKEIYLLGCDCSMIIPFINSRENKVHWEESHVYETDSQEKTITQYLSNNYSMESQLFGNARMFIGYRKLNEYCVKNKILLRNATSGGLLDNIKRVKYEELF